MSIGTYNLIKKIGSGSFGAVFKAVRTDSIDNAREVAVKIILDRIEYSQSQGRMVVRNQVYQEEKRGIELIQKEIVEKGLSPNFPYLSHIQDINYSDIDTRKDLKFPNMSAVKEKEFRLQLLDQKRVNDKHNLQGQMHLIEIELGITTQLAPLGDKTLTGNRKPTNDKMRSYIFQIFSALISLQVTNIQHRDIKQTNVVVTQKANRIDKYGYKKPYRWVYGNHTFEIPEADQDLVLLFIDYSLTKQIEKIENASLTYRPNSMYSRGPEHLFLTETPVYSIQSDLFAAGMSIIDMLTGTPSYVVKNYWPQIKMDTVHIISRVCSDNTLSNLAKRFLCIKDENFVGHILSLFYLLGIPTNNDLPKIEETKLYKAIMDPSRKIDWTKYTGVLLTDENITKYLDQEGLQLLKQILSWNPKNRGNPFELVTIHNYFARYRVQSPQQPQEDFSYFGATIQQKDAKLKTYKLTTASNTTIDYAVYDIHITTQNPPIGKNIQSNTQPLLLSQQKTNYFHKLAARKKLIVQLPGEPIPTSIQDMLHHSIQSPSEFPPNTLCWKVIK